jgi:outer membrane immunogenic protein
MRLAAVISGFALALFPSLSASAADVTPVAQSSIPATSGYIPARFYWTGFYLGTALGDAWGTSTLTDPFTAPAQTGTLSLNGLLVGGYGGVNYQIDSWVIGLEGDFTGTWANGSATDAAGDNLQTKVFWTASLTGRLGFAFDRLLVYGKGGAGFDYDRNYVTVGAIQTVGSDGHVGWTAGGGVDYAFTEHWIARLEYDYFKFTSNSFPLSGPKKNGTGTIGLSLNELKAAIAYKF